MLHATSLIKELRVLHLQRGSHFKRQSIINLYKQPVFTLILFNEQLDARFFFVYVYFNSLHVLSIQVHIIRRFNFVNTISGIQGVKGGMDQTSGGCSLC